MTKYILQSGNAKKFPEKLRKYNEEAFRDFLNSEGDDVCRDRISASSAGEPVKVLFNFFSQKREDWEIKYENYDKVLKENVDLELETKIAMPDEFEEQCHWADVIILVGGDDGLLQCRMSKFDVPKIWEGKVVAGGSAVANYLVESFWNCDWRKNMKGSGIVPIRFIPHYKSETYGKDDPRGPIDWDKAYRELEKFGDKSLPIYALEEGDFVVIEK